MLFGAEFHSLQISLFVCAHLEVQVGTHKSDFVELTTQSLLVGHIWFVICPTYGHYKTQISPTKTQLGPNPTCPLFTMGNPIVKTDAPIKWFVTQSLTTQNGWLVAHFGPMGTSFHKKKLLVLGGGYKSSFLGRSVRSVKKIAENSLLCGFFHPKNLTHYPKLIFYFRFRCGWHYWATFPPICALFYP